MISHAQLRTRCSCGSRRQLSAHTWAGRAEGIVSTRLSPQSITPAAPPSAQRVPTTTSASRGTTSSTQPELQLDPSGYTKYALAIPAQVGAMTGALWLLQQACNALSAGVVSLPLDVPVQDVDKALVAAFFLVVSIKSRIFSPLDASRPNVRGEKTAISQRKRPSWMPPPLTFPIVWTTIGLLRATTSVMVWEACGRELVSLPLIIMMTHLSIGDAWNHCNNVDQKLGMAVPGVILGCLGSGVWVTSAYYQADPSAGLLLSPMCLWLTIASALVFSIWSLNVDESTGQRQPLVPVKEAEA